MNTRGSRIVGDSTEDFGPLDLVMTGPYVPHVWKSPLKTNHVITIQFSGDLIDFLSEAQQEILGRDNG